MKNIFRNFITVSLLMAFTAIPAFAFPDLQQDSELAAHVDSLVQKSIISGYPDGTFKPEQTINRAEALKIIFATQSISTNDAYDSPFPDVPRDEWYSPYVGIAKGKGIISGYPDGNYRPTQAVNRAEFVKMTISSLPFFGNLPQGKTAAVEGYTDIDRKQWYIPYLAAAVQLKFLPTSKQFAPTAGMKRGDAAEIIYQMSQYLEQGQHDVQTDSATADIPEDAFVVSDPTVEHSYHPAEFGPDKLTVEKDMNKTDIHNTYGGYHVSLDELVDVKNLEVSPDQLTITTPEDCVVDIHTKDNTVEQLTPEQYFQKNFSDRSFMNAPKSTSLEKVGNHPGFQAYKMTARWKDHSREDYFIHSADKIYGLNGFSFGKKSDQECNRFSETIISHFELNSL